MFGYAIEKLIPLPPNADIMNYQWVLTVVSYRVMRIGNRYRVEMNRDKGIDKASISETKLLDQKYITWESANEYITVAAHQAWTTYGYKYFYDKGRMEHFYAKWEAWNLPLKNRLRRNLCKRVL